MKNSTFNLTSINYFGNSKYQTLNTVSSSTSRPPNTQLKKKNKRNKPQTLDNVNSFVPSPQKKSILSLLFNSKQNGFFNTVTAEPSNKKPKKNHSNIHQYPNKKHKVKDDEERISYFLVKNKKPFETTKKKFQRYLLDDELQYANLANMETQFKHDGLEYRNIINNNNKLIRTKQKELETLNSEMQRNIILNFKFTDKTLEDYETQFAEINTKISSLKYDLGTYEEEKLRLTNERTILDKRVKEAAKDLTQNQNSFEQYKIISETVKSETKGRNILLDQMREYQYQSSSLMDEKLRKKKEKYARLEYDLQEIKQYVEILDKKLEHLKHKQQKTKKKINDETGRGDKIKYDSANLRQDYFNNKMKLLLIYHQFKMKQIDKIVIKYQNDNIHYNTSSSIYNFRLKNLTELHNELTDEQNIHGNVYKQLDYENKPKVKKFKIKQFNENLMLKDETYGNIYKEISKLRYENELKTKIFYELTIKLKLVYNFMERYDQQFNNIIALTNFDIIHDSKNQILNFNFSINKINSFIHNIGMSNKDLNLKSTNINKKPFFLLSDYKTILNVFLKFYRKMCFLEHMLILGLYDEHHSTRNHKKNSVISIQNLFVNEQALEESKQNRFKIYEQKFAIKCMTNLNVFSKRISSNNNEIEIDNLQQKIPVTTIINRYAEKDNNDKVNTIFRTKAPPAFVPFTQELVFDDTNPQAKQKALKQSKKKQIKTIIDASYKPTLTEPSSTQLKRKKVDEYNYIYKDSDESDENSEIIINPYNYGDYDARNKNKKKSDDNSRGWEKMSKYQKMNDLYKLKYNLFSKKTGNKIYDEMYQQFGEKKNYKIYKEIKEKQQKKKQILRNQKKSYSRNISRGNDSRWHSSTNIRSSIEENKHNKNTDNEGSTKEIIIDEGKSKTSSNFKTFMKSNIMGTFFTQPPNNLSTRSKHVNEEHKTKKHNEKQKIKQV